MLYLISPPEIDDVTTFSTNLSSVFQEAQGAETIGAFQLRLKQVGSASGDRLTDHAASDDQLKYAIDALLPLCKEADIPLIINDHLPIACEMGVDGLHIGQEDGDVTEIRAQLGEDKLLGVSCHASRHLAMEAGEQGADYVAFGAFYPTQSKSAKSLEHWGTPKPDLLSWWRDHTILPSVAIGGISLENAPPLIHAGADFIAVISAIWNHPQSPAAAAKAFRHMLAGANAERAA